MTNTTTTALPAVGTVVEQNGTFYIVTDHATANLDTLSRLVMARRIVNIHTMETTKRAVRLFF